jgi:cytochrome o ubiquinol oxidase subunit 1
VGLFSLILGFAGVWHIWWLAALGLVGVIATLVMRSYNDDNDYTISAETVARMEGGGAQARELKELDLEEVM